MSKKSIIALVVAVVLVGSGVGVYYYMNSATDIEIKDSFKVGDKHALVYEYSDEMLRITGITGSGDDLIFETFDDWYGTQTGTYNELKSRILEVLCYTPEDASVDVMETFGEKRISTPFGDRDCIVYKREYDDYTMKYYVGKTNNVFYMSEDTDADGFSSYVEILQKSGMIIESDTEIDVIKAASLKEGDCIEYSAKASSTYEIEEVNPAEGDEPETYKFKGSDSPKTRQEVIGYLNLVVPEGYRDIIGDPVGSEKVNTSLGKVKCDVYKYYDEDEGVESKVFVSNGIIVKIESEELRYTIYWENTDLIVKKQSISINF